MTPHTHREFVEGCYRCDLSRDEVRSAHREDAIEVATQAVMWWHAGLGSEPLTTEQYVREQSSVTLDALLASSLVVLRSELDQVDTETIERAVACIDGVIADGREPERYVDWYREAREDLTTGVLYRLADSPTPEAKS